MTIPKNTHVTLSGEYCNVDLPNTGSTMDRFLWVIKESIRMGLYVIIDYHGMGQEDYPRYPMRFIDLWENLWRKIVGMKEFKGEIDKRIILDIFNEPDSMGLKWKHMQELYLGVMDRLTGVDRLLLKSEVHETFVLTASFFPKFSINTPPIVDISPLMTKGPTFKPLFMLEGTGQTAWNMNWGDGFVSNKTITMREGIDNAGAFFIELDKRRYAKDLVIISPHIYGPSITKSSKAYKGPELYERLWASFGYLIGKYPIVIGEFGSSFEDQRDFELYRDFSLWMRKNGIKSWLYWNYAENSADTRDIARNNFQDLDWFVLDWLRVNFRL
jgi:hypothetical protein